MAINQNFGQSQMDYPSPSKENNYLQNFGFKNGYKPVGAGNKGKLPAKKVPSQPKPSIKPKKVVKPTFNQVQKSVSKTMGKK